MNIMKNKGWIPQGRLLAMDTSTASMSVAILEDGRLLKEINSHAERNHSIYLLPHVQEALNELGFTARELDGIVVGQGPGSYTGVRIGVTVAKTMAWTLKLPVVGVSSLEAIAAGGMAEWSDRYGAAHASVTVRLVPLLNARRGQVYTALYETAHSMPADREASLYPVGASSWTTRAEDAIRPLDRWLDELGQLNADSATAEPVVTVFLGETEGFEPLLDKFRSQATEPAYVIEVSIQAQHVGMLGYKRLLSGDTLNPHLLLPNYTQLAEAEAKLQSKA